MNACETCPFGSTLNDATNTLETFSRELTDRSDKVWELAMRTHDAAQEFNSLSQNPGAIAQVDQTQSHILDTTARLSRISQEVRTLLSETFERAEATACPIENDTAIKCPRMDIVLGVQPELDGILADLPQSKR